MTAPCTFKGCSLPAQHISDCEPTHAGKLAYWNERALDLRASMERDGLSRDEVGQVLIGAAPTMRPPPMFPPELRGPASELDELEPRSRNPMPTLNDDLSAQVKRPCDISGDLKGRGGML